MCTHVALIPFLVYTYVIRFCLFASSRSSFPRLVPETSGPSHSFMAAHGRNVLRNLQSVACGKTQTITPSPNSRGHANNTPYTPTTHMRICVHFYAGFNITNLIKGRVRTAFKMWRRLAHVYWTNANITPTFKQYTCNRELPRPALETYSQQSVYIPLSMLCMFRSYIFRGNSSIMG